MGPNFYKLLSQGTMVEPVLMFVSSTIGFCARVGVSGGSRTENNIDNVQHSGGMNT
jgi:hypothetical protein